MNAHCISFVFAAWLLVCCAACTQEPARASTDGGADASGDAVDAHAGSDEGGTDAETRDAASLHAQDAGGDDSAVHAGDLDAATDAGLECPTSQECLVPGSVCLPDGRCKVPFCRGDSDCINGAVYACSERGTAATFVQQCDAASQRCRRANGQAACAPLCNPGEPICSGNLLSTCNAAGSGAEPGGVDCTSSGQVCDGVLATCVPKICEPYTTYCKDGDVHQCLGAGGSEQVFAECYEDEFCKSYATSAYCVADECDLSDKGCVRNMATTCLADGSWDTGTGTDCGDPSVQACVGGECRPVICTPGTVECVDGGVRECWYSGTEFSPYTMCRATEHCGMEECVPDVCPKGQALCRENRIVMCKEDGSALDAGGTDCSATNQICDASLQCASEAIDDVTPSGPVSPSWHGPSVAYEVHSSRHLTEIEMPFVVTGAISDVITWFVYESSDYVLYTKVFELNQPVGDRSATVWRTGAISVTLSAGKRYLIGVQSADSLTLTHDYVGDGQQTSFGAVVGAANRDSLPGTLSLYNWSGHFPQRLTTVP